MITSATFTVPDFGLALLSLSRFAAGGGEESAWTRQRLRLSFSPSTLSLAESLSGDGGCRHSLNASRGRHLRHRVQILKQLRLLGA